MVAGLDKLRDRAKQAEQDRLAAEAKERNNKNKLKAAEKAIRDSRAFLIGHAVQRVELTEAERLTIAGILSRAGLSGKDRGKLSDFLPPSPAPSITEAAGEILQQAAE